MKTLATFTWISVVCGAVACAGSTEAWTPAQSRSLAPGKLRAEAYRSGEWLPLPDVDQARYAVRSLDGSVRLISHGVRVVVDAGGAVVRAADELPVRHVKAVELPERLGGGYLFFAGEQGATSIWKAETFTSELKPFAKLSPVITRITVGFDRLYATDRDGPTLRGLDAQTGADIGLGPLPTAPGFGGFAFADAWTAVVHADVLGLLATFDAGNTWHPLGMNSGDVTRVELAEDGIEFDTEQGAFLMSVDGRLSRKLGHEDDRLFASARDIEAAEALASEVAETPRDDPGGGRLLARALLYGWQDGPKSALVADRGELTRVSLVDGAALASQATQALRGLECQTVPLGEDLGLVCSSGDDELTAFRRVGDLGVEPLFSLKSRQYFAATGDGGLVISGRCPGALGDAAVRNAAAPSNGGDGHTYCLRSRDGETSEVRVQGDLGAERVTVLRDGRGAVLIPPRLGTAGTLTVVTNTNPQTPKQSSHPLRLDGIAPGTAALINNGLWLRGLTQREDGRLATWVVGADTFVGVTIGLDGRVQASPVRQDVAHTLFFGAVSLTMGTGVAQESTNYGFDVRKVSVPRALDTDSDGSAARPRVRGCSLLGCVWDDWLRVGFSPSEAVTEKEPTAPELVRGPTRPYQRFALTCHASGRQSAGQTAQKERAGTGQQASGHQGSRAQGARATAPQTDLARWRLSDASPLTLGSMQSSAWTGFLGSAAPEKPSGYLGFTTGDRSPEPYWVYAWGPRSNGWARESEWQIYLVDPFSVAPPWTSSRARSPWADPILAAQDLGRDPAVSALWDLDRDPSGHGAALLLRSRATSELFLFEPGSAPVHVQQVQKFGVLRTLGAVKVNGSWFFAHRVGGWLRVHQVRGNEASLFRQYPLVSGDVQARLVRSVAGDALGIWVRAGATGWYVVPLDLDTGNTGNVQFVGLDALAKVPPLCEPEAEGWLVESTAPLPSTTGSRSNVFVDFSGPDQGTRVGRISAQLLVNDGQVCVLALSGQAEAGQRLLGTGARVPGARRVPLVLSEGASGRRVEYQCDAER